MKNLTLVIFILFPFFLHAQSPTVESAGFQESLFDRATIEVVLSEANCVGVRFYNIRPNDNSPAAVICVGIDREGNEINKSSASAYKQGAGGDIQKTVLNNNKAKQDCQRLKNSGLFSYSADFTKQQIKKLLSQSNSDAILITPVINANEQLSMKIQAVDLTEGRRNLLGMNYVSSDPCPVLCGSTSKYLHLGSN